MWRAFSLFLAALAAIFIGLSPAYAQGPSMSNAVMDPTWAPTVPAPPGGWWVEDGVYVRVHADGSDVQTARRIADHANRIYPKLGERMSLSLGGLVELYIAPTQAAFSDIQPGAPPDWADGTAWPMKGLVFLRSPRIRPGTADPLEQVTTHELVHILVGRAFAPKIPPRWLQEGLAEFYAGELGPQRAEEILQGLSGEGLLRLSDIEHGFPVNAQRARLAYAQSVDFVAFLESEYGEAALPTLLQKMAAGAPMRQAIWAATGEDAATVEAQWLGRWDNPWLRLPQWGESVMWVGLVAALFIGGWRLRARNQRILRRWEEEERAEEEARRALLSRFD